MKFTPAESTILFEEEERRIIEESMRGEIIDEMSETLLLGDTIIGNVVKNLKFWSKMEIWFRNRNFGQKMEILFENRNFGQKSEVS